MEPETPDDALDDPLAEAERCAAERARLELAEAELKRARKAHEDAVIDRNDAQRELDRCLNLGPVVT